MRIKKFRAAAKPWALATLMASLFFIPMAIGRIQSYSAIEKEVATAAGRITKYTGGKNGITEYGFYVGNTSYHGSGGCRSDCREGAEVTIYYRKSNPYESMLISPEQAKADEIYLCLVMIFLLPAAIALLVLIREPKTFSG